MAETPVKPTKKGEPAQSWKQVKAFARHIHMSPRKLRLVADVIRNKRVDFALEQLRYSSKTAALPIMKVINSAIANAAHNYDIKKENLFLKAITIDGGPVTKKMEPRAQGRGFIVRHRTSHINLILEERITKSAKKPARAVFSTVRKKTVVAADKPGKETDEGKVTGDKDKPVVAPKSQEKIKANTVANKRRLFNRKSGE